MSLRSTSTKLALAAMLACAGIARAESLSLNQPMYADDETPAPRAPLMSALDKVGAGKTLDDMGVTMNGYIEGSWTYNFARPKDQTNVGRSFDFEDQDLTLNQIDFNVERDVDASKGKFDIGFKVEWIFGADARFMHSSGLNFYGPGDADKGGQAFPNNQLDLNQAYLTFAVPVGTGLTITAGKFVTPLGYEAVNITSNGLTNMTYSHSFLFAFATPFSQTGVTAKYNVTKEAALTLGMTRGWEQTSNDNNGAVDGFGSLNWSISDKLSATVTISVGPQLPDDTSHYTTLVDAYGTYKLGDNTQITLDTTYGYGSRQGNDIGGDGKPGSGDWWGAALYVSQHLCKYANLNVRAEYFNDDDGCRGLDSSVEEITLGLAITPLPDSKCLSNLVFRPEIRWDHASDEIFNDGNDKNQFTVAGDLVFAF